MKKVFFIAWVISNLLCIKLAKGDSRISGRLPFLKNGDSVALRTCAYGIHSFFTTRLNREFIAKVNDGAFSFHVEATTKPMYFAITFFTGQAGRFINGSYFLEDGDDIRVDQVNSINYVHFSGRGSQKLNIIYQLAQMAQYYLRQYPEPKAAKDLAIYFAGQDSLYKAQVQYLKEQAPFISTTAFRQIEADILSRNIGKYGMAELFEKLNKPTKITSADYKDYHDPFAELSSFNSFSQNPFLQYAERFNTAVLAKFKFDSCRVQNRPFDMAHYYTYLKHNFGGMPRERLVTSFLYENRDTPFDQSLALDDAKAFVHDPDFVQVLFKLKKQRTKGVKADDFALPDTAGIIHRLSEFKGKVVVLDIWFTGCGFCINAGAILKRMEEKFAQNKAVAFLSICEDKNKTSWVNSIRKGIYTSNLALNLYTMGLGEQHDFIKYYDIQGSAILVVDKNGKLMNNPVNILQDNGSSIENLIHTGLAGH